MADIKTKIAQEPHALDLTNLSVAYRSGGQDKAVLRNVSLTIGRGEAYGLVGESGCGKSTAALAIMHYLPRVGKITSGSIRVDGEDISGLTAEGLRKLRAETMSMVYQDPGKALNPSIRIGPQITEIFALGGVKAEEAHTRAVAMLEQVRISDTISVMQRYPHQLSGGMQQRVVIAMALSKNPALLILDEPTTGLDATVEAEVLDLVATLRRELGTSILFISHNLAIVSKMCDRVGVLYAGMLVEEGTSGELFSNPRHPYTAALLRCLPHAGQRKDRDRLETIPGSPPPPGSQIAGCAFANRCNLADDLCRKTPPPLFDLGDHYARCHYHEQVPSMPRTTPAEARVGLMAETDTRPVLEIKNLSKTFANGARSLQAVRDVSLTLENGETLGLVGESGSGKSTFARLLLGLMAPDVGSAIGLDDVALPQLLKERSNDQVKAMQIVFQNPDSALNRSHRISHLLGRALKRLGGLTGNALQERLAELVHSVRLTEHHLHLKPRQLSGGLKQRVAIARAFAGNPRLVVCDEPTSALDVSVQAAILNLLADLQAEHRVSYIFISHDLAVVRYLSDKVAVLYLGRIMEIGPSDRVFDGPQHPYTEALLSAVPRLDGEPTSRIRLEGEIPSASDPPSGCVFHTRCPRKIGAICEEQEPMLLEAEIGHSLRCHIPIEELARSQQNEKTFLATTLTKDAAPVNMETSQH